YARGTVPQDGAGAQWGNAALEDLVEQAYRDPRRIRETIESAFYLGRGVAPAERCDAQALAARLRRKAKVVQEYDRRAALVEMAKELEGAVHLGTEKERAHATASNQEAEA